MQAALEEAKRADARDEVPIGAVLVDEKGRIIAKNGNRTREMNDPSAHAEILCVREACKAANAQRIPGYTLYVTLEPCTMCAAALSFARIKRVVFGASDPKGGGILHGGRFYEQPTCHHKPEVSHGLMEEECGLILRDFFKKRR
ncbi:MAG: nucleoside deaminase [Alphaproteobacteria bacterium]|nr:nucleoside deaminase [Alphaproteobacteria bacterium]